MDFVYSIQDIINLLLVAVGIGVCFLCLLQITVSDHLRKEIRRYFQVFFTMILLYITSHLIRQLFDGIPGEGIRTLLFSVTYLELMGRFYVIYDVGVCACSFQSAAGEGVAIKTCASYFPCSSCLHCYIRTDLRVHLCVR